MSNSTPMIQGYYSLSTFHTLRDLWQQMAAMIEGDVSLITNADVAIESLPQFSLLQSDKFQGLLTGKVVNLANLQQIQIEISFDPHQINEFLRPLLSHVPAPTKLITTEFINDCRLQSQFTQLLLAALNHDRVSDREIQLQQQVAASNLLDDISAQIHQALELSVILQAAVDRVQAFLQVDRLLLYQLESIDIAGAEPADTRLHGRVTHEALANPEIGSMLHTTHPEDCVNERQLWDKYRDGMTKSIDRVEIAYTEHPYALALMERHQVKSQAIVPIMVNSQLWGLAIAHQCQSVRNWQASEIQFLERITEHLAFAVHRSELYAANLWHTQSLEQRVNERTQELRDAVIVAQTANQSKTEFLALLSHELRTPLTSILGLSATLLRIPLLNLTDRQQNYLQTIHNSGEHLSELIDDILDFYKLEVGKTFLRVSEFSLSKLIKQTVEIVRDKAEQAKIDIEIAIINNGMDVSQVGGRDLRFRGDTKRIRQILLNLLVNAIKFTPEQGTIVIRTWLEDRYAVFEIEDSGIGIEKEQVPRLFRKFHQLNQQYDRDYAGMGLGLAITQQLVELHGGWIDVDSIVGSGSTFTVRVASQPLQFPEQVNDWDEMDRKLVAQDPELNPIPKRLILIEHDDVLADFICDILTAARYQVTWLLSAESSFRQILMLQPDLLIVDLTSDRETIDKLVQNIRRSPVIDRLKIIAIADKEVPLSPIAKQYLDDYLWKQVNPEQLLRKIAKLLS